MVVSSRTSGALCILFGCDRFHAVYSSIGDCDAGREKPQYPARRVKPYLSLHWLAFDFCCCPAVFKLLLQLAPVSADCLPRQLLREAPSLG